MEILLGRLFWSKEWIIGRLRRSNVGKSPTANMQKGMVTIIFETCIHMLYYFLAHADGGPHSLSAVWWYGRM